MAQRYLVASMCPGSIGGRKRWLRLRESIEVDVDKYVEVEIERVGCNLLQLRSEDHTTGLG